MNTLPVHCPKYISKHSEIDGTFVPALVKKINKKHVIKTLPDELLKNAELRIYTHDKVICYIRHTPPHPHQMADGVFFWQSLAATSSVC